MENFFIEENFCSDIEDLMRHCDIEEEDVAALSEDWSIGIEEATLEPIIKFDITDFDNFIEDLLDTYVERFPEDPDTTLERVRKALEQSIDFEKLNSLVPKLYYPNSVFGQITKQDLIEFIS